jgi:hypothetical protein
MGGPVIIAVIALIAVVAIALIALKGKWEAAVAIGVISIVLMIFSKPIEDTWTCFFAQEDDKCRSASTSTSETEDALPEQGTEETSGPSATSDETAKEPSTSSPVTRDPGPEFDDSPVPDITPSRVLEPVYLADSSRVNGGKGIVLDGSSSINGKEYLNSIYVCSELSYINIYCNSDKSVTWWAEYVAPEGMRTFRTVIGLSDRSPSDCQTSVRLEIGGDVAFEGELVAGAQYDRRWAAPPGTRVILRVRPIAGTGRCSSVLGDARFAP